MSICPCHVRTLKKKRVKCKIWALIYERSSKNHQKIIEKKISCPISTCLWFFIDIFWWFFRSKIINWCWNFTCSIGNPVSSQIQNFRVSNLFLIFCRSFFDDFSASWSQICAEISHAVLETLNLVKFKISGWGT